MERERSPADDSEPEEIPHINSLSLAQLEASLAQQEAYSREVLANALANRQAAKRYRETAIQCDANVQTSRVRYEEAERIIHELRKALVERKKNTLAEHSEPGHVQAAGKRHETVIKVEYLTASLPPHASGESVAAHNRRPLIDDSLSDEDLDDESDDDESQDYTPDEWVPNQDSDHGEEGFKPAFRPQRVTKAIEPTPQAAPREVFAHSATTHPSRMIRRDNPKKEIIIYTSGQFVAAKKRKSAGAGCAVIYETETTQGRFKSVTFPLEQQGPEGLPHKMDQKTAELRALVAALELRLWSAEGWEKATIATSSIYAHRGITASIGHWSKQGWLDGADIHGQQLQNFDLWARAIELVNEHAYRGCEVQFWLIKSSEAKDAEVAAQSAASKWTSPRVYKPMADFRKTWTA